MGVRTWIEGWPVYRQLAGGDVMGRGAAAKSPASDRLVARTVTADKGAKLIQIDPRFTRTSALANGDGRRALPRGPGGHLCAGQPGAGGARRRRGTPGTA